MEQIALIAGEYVIYWKNLMLAAAAVCAVVCFMAFYVRDRQTLMSALIGVPLTLVLSLYSARAIHWYCHPSNYPGLGAALLDLSAGDFALIGVFFGAVVAVCLLKLFRLAPDAGTLLESMSMAGACGIGIGRLASLFDTSCRGLILKDGSLYPLSFPMVDRVSGETEYRLATFLLQSGVAWLLLGLMLVMRARDKQSRHDRWLIFMLLYGAAQAVLDSTRYDPLSFRSNGFVSIVQAMSAAAVVFVGVVFSVRMVRERGLRPWAFGLWLGILGALGGAGYMEYYVQRHGYKALFSYTCMTLFLLLAVSLILTVRKLSLTGGKQTKMRGRYLRQT